MKNMVSWSTAEVEGLLNEFDFIKEKATVVFTVTCDPQYMPLTDKEWWKRAEKLTLDTFFVCLKWGVRIKHNSFRHMWE